MEHGTGRDRELPHAGGIGTPEAAAADGIWFEVSALGAERLALVRGPAECAEGCICGILRQLPQHVGSDVAGEFRQKEMLPDVLGEIRPVALIVFPTSGLLPRKGRRRWEPEWEGWYGA